MEAMSRDGGHGLWSYRERTGKSSSYTVSSSSGTVSTGGYTSTGSHLSWISMEATMHLEEDLPLSWEEGEKEETEFAQPPVQKRPRNAETEEDKTLKQFKRLLKEFFGAPSAKRSKSVLQRWFTDLGVGWVLHLVADGKLVLQVNNASSWGWALTKIVDTIRLALTTSPFPGHDGSVDEQAGPCTEREDQDTMDQFQFASFTQQAMLRMLAFVDLIVCQDFTVHFSLPPAAYQKLHALLHVRKPLSDALSSEIRLPSPSAEVEMVLGEIRSVLSAKEGKVRVAIWDTMEEIRTRILESMEDGQGSSGIQTIRGSSDIHKATFSVVNYVCFLLGSNYSSVASIVSEAANRGKYVPQIGDVPQLWSLVVEMVSCVQEKLANKSEALFLDESLRCLFLLNNSYFVRDQLRQTFTYPIPESYEAALTAKVQGYMASYIQVCWAPVLASLLDPTPRCFGKTYSTVPKFVSEFQKTYATQWLWKVPDPRLRKTLREAIIEEIIPVYTKYIEDNKEAAIQKFTPRNLEEMLQGLFEG